MECYVPTRDQQEGAVRGAVAGFTWAVAPPAGECARCGSALTGTVVTAHAQVGGIHVACITAEEMAARRWACMPALTRAEAAKLAGIKPTLKAPEKSTAPKAWVKALNAAVESPRFTLSTFELTDVLDTDLKRALAAAGAITAQGSVKFDG